MLSKTCVYAIRAALLVTVKQDTEGLRFVPVRVLAEALGLSFHFLTKVLQILTQAGLMTSFRGPNGGVGLARPASSIRLIDLVEAVDGLDLFESCLLGLPGCGTETPCPLHNEWEKRRNQIRRMFERATLAGLARRIEEGHLRP